MTLPVSEEINTQMLVLSVTQTHTHVIAAHTMHRDCAIHLHPKGGEGDVRQVRDHSFRKEVRVSLYWIAKHRAGLHEQVSAE